MSMGIDPIMLKKLAQLQSVQKTQKVGNKSQQQAGGASSLMERLNGLDNKLNQGGGVKLSESAGQAGGIEEMLKKMKLS